MPLFPELSNLPTIRQIRKKRFGVLGRNGRPFDGVRLAPEVDHDPHDAVFAFMRWRGDLPSPYGPLFTLASYALAPLSVAASLWVLKGAAAVASLAILWLVYDCARRSLKADRYRQIAIEKIYDFVNPTV